MVWTGSIWLRIGTSGGLLWTRWWTFGFHKMVGSYWVAAQLAASQEGLSSMKLVIVIYINEPRPLVFVCAFTYSAHNKVHFLNLFPSSFPKAWPYLKRTSIKLTSGHCLGTWNQDFLSPLPKLCLPLLPHVLSLFLSSYTYWSILC
jgi:hypothetical protein